MPTHRYIDWPRHALAVLALIISLGCSTELYAQAAAPPATSETVVSPALNSDEASPVEAAELTYFDELMDKVEKGGVIMIILLILSIVGSGYIFERLINLNRSHITTPGLADQANALYMAGKYDQVHDLCKDDRSALARIIQAVVDHRECSVADIQTIAGEIGSRVMRGHLQKAYPLAIIATLSPLLGLLGTIMGMVGAFGTVATVGEMGDASILADDISKALVTTAGGLIVAIPMLGFYHLFRAKTNSLSIALEEDVSELISAWFLRRSAAPAKPHTAPQPAEPTDEN